MFPVSFQAQRGVRGQQPLRVAPGLRLHRQPDQTAAAGQTVRAGPAVGGKSPDLRARGKSQSGDTKTAWRPADWLFPRKLPSVFLCPGA